MHDKRILVVEDDFMNMKLTRHILEAEGYDVLQATTAREAIEQIKAAPPDLILIDVYLPDMDGMTAVRIIRESTGARDIAILALTACAMKGDREKAIIAGCDNYLSKPINIHQLREMVTELLFQRRKRIMPGANGDSDGQEDTCCR